MTNRQYLGDVFEILLACTSGLLDRKMYLSIATTVINKKLVLTFFSLATKYDISPGSTPETSPRSREVVAS